MTILALLAALVPLLIWWIKRAAEKRDDPIEQNRKRCAQADADIARGDGVAAGVNGAADLDELERLQRANRNQSGSNSDPAPGGQDLHGPV